MFSIMQYVRDEPSLVHFIFPACTQPVQYFILRQPLALLPSIYSTTSPLVSASHSFPLRHQRSPVAFDELLLSRSQFEAASKAKNPSVRTGIGNYR